MKNIGLHSRLIGVLVLGGGLLIALPLALTSGASASAPGQYCVASLAGQSTVECFTTFGASVSFATGGTVNLTNAAVARYVTPSELQADVSPDSDVLAIDYTGTGYSGSSLVWTGAGCTSTVGGANMPAGWDDVTESVAAYSGCATTFEQKNYGQPEYAIHVNASVSSLGSFNNEADSQLFCNYFGCEE